MPLQEKDEPQAETPSAAVRGEGEELPCFSHGPGSEQTLATKNPGKATNPKAARGSGWGSGQRPSWGSPWRSTQKVPNAPHPRLCTSLSILLRRSPAPVTGWVGEGTRRKLGYALITSGHGVGSQNLQLGVLQLQPWLGRGRGGILHLSLPDFMRKQRENAMSGLA